MNYGKTHNAGNSRIVRLYALSFLTAVILLLMFFLKYIGLEEAGTLVYFYTVGVTTFELSRIMGSFFYSDDRKANSKKGTNPEPPVSFIIPVKNEGRIIAETIRKCYDVNYPKNKLEVVIINDGSTDNTWNEIEKMKKAYPSLVAINWEKNRGKRHAMSEGFRKAAGEIVIQLDSDSYLERDSLRKLMKPFSDARIAAVSAHTDPVNRDKNVLTRMQAAYYFVAFRALKASESIFNMVFCCSGCCSAYRKAAILPLLDKWTNEIFLGKKVSWGDDRSLTNLVLKSGYKTVYSSTAQAYTIVPDSLKMFLKQQVRWKKSWIVNSIGASKFIMKKDAFVAVTYFFPMIIISILAPIIAFKALVINPLFFDKFPFFYLSGVFLISSLLTVHYQFFRNDRNWKYIFVWSFLNMTLLSYVILYSLADIRNTGWGTR